MLCCVAGIAPLVACGQPSATTLTTPAVSPTATPFGAPPPLPGGWKTYRDPRGAFTLQVPQDWAADVAVGEWIAPGGPTPDYDTALGDPPRGPTMPTIRFDVDYHALPAAAPGCTAPPGQAGSTTATVAGLPATYLVVGRHEEWYLAVGSDSFLLTWSWPGYAGDWPGILDPPTYPDPATWHADQVLAHLILASFRPAGAPTAPCP